ncbi:MAG: DUF983 domain-containing protein, partial [Pseudomonadota bacterium]
TDNRSWTSGLWRGLKKRCPKCGKGALFRGYTTVNRQCSECGLHLDSREADDAPPYLTIMIVGHIVIPLALLVKQLADPPLLVQFAIWAPLIILATFVTLPMTKGAMIGVQWANHMHGFGDNPPETGEIPLEY